MIKRFLPVLIVLFVSTAAFGISSDPSEIGIGARPMGMGRAFVALPGNFLVNPAGIADINSLNFLSMSGSLFQNTVNYTVLGVAYPFDFGTLGLSYVNSGTSGMELTQIVNGTIEVIGTTDSYNSVYVGSYAFPLNFLTSRLEFIPKYDFINDISAGLNLKYFSQGYSALAGESGSGFDIDGGILYNPADLPFSLGVCVQNALPFSLGGKFVWENNVEEGIPAIVKIGGVYYLFDRSLALALDSRSYISEDKPSVYHAGIEWWPISFFALRLGVDQQSSAVEVNNNLTGGIGINYRGFTLDYAYHQYGDIAENTTHYFSLGYAGVKEEKPKEVKPPVVEVKAVPKTTLKTFIDVSGDYWAKDAIERLATAGVITGYPDGTFRPDRTLSRAELCTLLIKAKGTSVSAPRIAVFTDLPETHWAAPYVAETVSLRIVSGYPDGTFKPSDPLTRAEAIKIIAVFDGLKIEGLRAKPFPDVPVSHWAAPYIAAAKKAGLLGYIKDDFVPNQDLTRAEAAWILSKTNFVKGKYPDLF
jgi:hypothetical protein